MKQKILMPMGVLLIVAGTMPTLAQRDMDCSDFRSWREAQDFFNRSGPGDPHGLDRDRDGIACESLR